MSASASCDPCCPECRSFDIVTDYSAGDVICRDCGIIIGAHIIDDRNDHMSYCNEESSSISRVATNTADNESGTFLSTTTGSHNAGSKNMQRELTQLMSRVDAPTTRDKWKRAGLALLAMVVERLGGVDARTRTCAEALFVASLGTHDWHSKKHVAAGSAACLYMACRHTHTGRSFHELEKVSGVSIKQLGRMFKLLAKDTTLALSVTSLADYLERFCNHGNVPIKTRILATHVAAQPTAGTLSQDKAPRLMAAAILYFVIALTSKQHTLSELAAWTTVNEASIKALTRELNTHRVVLFQGIELS